jgi:hypothetical protein
MTDTEQPKAEQHDEDNLQRAAEEGPLPGVMAEDDEQQRGQDHSATNDPEAEADDAGRGDIVGGIAMH